jgi:hypothetical protein
LSQEFLTSVRNLQEVPDITPPPLPIIATQDNSAVPLFFPVIFYSLFFKKGVYFNRKVVDGICFNPEALNSNIEIEASLWY